MPNIKSAEKRVLVNASKAARNRVEKSALKTSIKKVSAAVAEGERASAVPVYQSAQSSIDRAAAHGLIHKNTAARRKSRLARQINKLGNA
ncbi:30S ribosomal protein S20 [Clostridia bacterium]|nr:30S ribosomal protein S20 [Clostridia bacterium]